MNAHGSYYPVLLDLAGKRCVVVGGGAVAERKVASLLDCGARVVVVAIQATAGIAAFAEQGLICLSSKPYEDADLADARLVIAAATPEVNQTVAADAQRRDIWVNVVDDPERCDFIVPAVARRGPLVIAISSQGASPAIARRLREMIEQAVGPEYGDLAELLGNLRPEVLARGGEDEHRRVWEAILGSAVLELLRQGKRAEAELEARRCISSVQG